LVKCTASSVLPAGDSRNEVHLRGGDPLCLVPELVSEEHDEEEWDREVVGYEGGGVPVALEEDPPVGEDDDDHRPHQTPPSGVWGELAVPWEALKADSLRLQPLSETDTGETDTEPVEHPRHRAHVGEPVEDCARRLGDTHVGQGAKNGTKGQREDGRSSGVGASEDLGGLTGLGETV